MKIGIISDTHSYRSGECYQLPDWVVQAFSGADLIIHCGDVETKEVLQALNAIAPTYAVRGNCDPASLNTPQTISIDIGCGLLTAAHKANHAHLALQPNSRVMAYGHTHISTISQENGLIIINPGSPSFPRGGMPPSVGLLHIENGQIFPQILTK